MASVTSTSNVNVQVIVGLYINTPWIIIFISDDNIDEDEQSFAEIGPDVTDGISCFQIAEGGRECRGRQGATEIRITDNDREFSN